MGTSASSVGPGPGVPFDPPWLDDIESPIPEGEVPDPDATGTSDAEPTPPPEPSPPIAPPGRFANARRALTNFVKTGREGSFRKAAGHYSRTGMGGARRVAYRLRSSTAIAAHVFGMLRAAREGTDPSINKWVSSLTSRVASVQDVVDEIIRRAVPSGGSQDESASQESMYQALQDLIAENENVDILHLGDEEIWTLIELFLGYEAFNRLCLDIGQVFERSAFSVRERVERVNEMQEYLKGDIHAQIERLRDNIQAANSDQLQAVLHKGIENTFAVYEGAI